MVMVWAGIGILRFIRRSALQSAILSGIGLWRDLLQMDFKTHL